MTGGFAMASQNVEILVELQRRVVAERSRVVASLAGLSGAEVLPGNALRDLAVLQGAITAIADEIAAHTPTIGHGAEN
jgi:hypothetical protein